MGGGPRCFSAWLRGPGAEGTGQAAAGIDEKLRGGLCTQAVRGSVVVGAGLVAAQGSSVEGAGSREQQGL